MFRLLDKDQNGIVQLSLAEVSDSRLEELLLVDETLKSLDRIGARLYLFQPISLFPWNPHMFCSGREEKEWDSLLSLLSILIN